MATKPKQTVVVIGGSFNPYEFRHGNVDHTCVYRCELWEKRLLGSPPWLPDTYPDCMYNSEKVSK